jgi:hypothetical protein
MVFLLLGSEFGNEVEFGSGFGGKDNMPNGSADHQQDWNCLNNFLACLKNGHGEVFISLREKEKSKVPKEFKKTIMEWTEGGYQPEEEKKPTENNSFNQKPKPSSSGSGGSGSSSSQTNQDPWIRAGFSALQKKEWVDIGLGESDTDFCAWLRDSKRMTPDYVLNYGNMEELRREFESSHANFD